MVSNTQPFSAAINWLSVNHETHGAKVAKMKFDFLEKLRQVLRYDPQTGELTWLSSFGVSINAGDQAGYLDKRDNRQYIRFQGKRYSSHRLAWLLTYGQWPNGVIDHLDGNPSNNRLKNLRDVSQSVNLQNQRKAKSSNETGFLGVTWHKRDHRFVANIGINGKTKYLGSFLTAEAAHGAYLSAKRKFHEGCTI